MATCNSCGSPVQWATTDTGKQMPVDVAPADTGNVRVYRDDWGKVRSHTLKQDELQAARDAGEPLYLSHFATCPNAKRHRR